jgi:hypothetical protein
MGTRCSDAYFRPGQPDTLRAFGCHSYGKAVEPWALDAGRKQNGSFRAGQSVAAPLVKCPLLVTVEVLDEASDWFFKTFQRLLDCGEAP